MSNGNGEAMPVLARVAIELLTKVGFPILVASYLLWETRPLMLEMVRQQAVMVSQLQNLGARSCVLPFTRQPEVVPPMPAEPPAPGAFRHLGLRHSRVLVWASPSPSSKVERTACAGCGAGSLSPDG